MGSVPLCFVSVLEGRIPTSIGTSISPSGEFFNCKRSSGIFELFCFFFGFMSGLSIFFCAVPVFALLLPSFGLLSTALLELVR